jgi:pentatricopeptide repeat protein
MRTRGIKPSQVTYWILLDGCINENHIDCAAVVADCMAREGCEMKTVMCTTLIKGFARAGQLERAMKVYEQMRTRRGPDLITFSILIKANCDSSQMEDALILFESMWDLGLKPDEVVFNNLLGVCLKESYAELGKRLYEDMVVGGVRPSSATFSMLIRLYAQLRC